MTTTTVVHKHAHALLKGISRNQREVRFVATRFEIDRDGEVIDPNGLDVKAYKKNPVFLLQHNPDRPIGRVTSLNLGLVDEALAWTGVARIDPPGTSDDADRAYKQIDAGSLNGISIGFRVEEATPRAVLPGQTGPTYKRTSLLEISLVTIPSCANCLILEKTLRKENPMSGCACQQPDVIDWDAINRSIESKEIDWDRINLPSAGVEVNVTKEQVNRVIAAYVPAILDGVRKGIKLHARLAAERAINRLTGRLD